MTQDQIKTIIKAIEAIIQDAQKMYKSQNEPLAYVVGYLEGTLNVVKEELEKHIEETAIS